MALAEHALPASELAAIEEHVASCADCRALVGHVAATSGDVPAADETRRVGRYELERILGSGGMGTVWEAWDPMLERRIAIKLLHDDVEEQHGDRLLREARALAKLQHPHVVAIHDVGSFEHRFFLATELVDGEPLDRWQIDRTPHELCAAYAQAARGLAAAHAIGLVHRDVKPANILVGRDRRVRVGDFGLVAEDARQGGGGSARLTRSGHVVGTPAYMAPEQRTRGAVDARADQYSLCLALAEALLGGRPPFEADADELAARGVPGPWETIVRGLATRPSERFAGIDEVAAALEEFSGAEPIAVPRRVNQSDPRITVPERPRGRESSRQIAATIPERPGTSTARRLARAAESSETPAAAPTSLATTTERDRTPTPAEPPRDVASDEATPDEQPGPHDEEPPKRRSGPLDEDARERRDSARPKRPSEQPDEDHRRDSARPKRPSAQPDEAQRRDSARPKRSSRQLDEDQRPDPSATKRRSERALDGKRDSKRTPVAFATTAVSDEPRSSSRTIAPAVPGTRARRSLALAAALGVVLVIALALVWRSCAASSRPEQVSGPPPELLESRLLVATRQLASGQTDACLETLAAAGAAYQHEAPLVKLRASCAMASGDCAAASTVERLMPAAELDALRKRTSCAPLEGDGKMRIAALRKLAAEPALWDRRCRYVDREVRALIVRRDVEPDDKALPELATSALRCWGRLGKCDEARALVDATRLALVRVKADDVPECKLSDPPEFAINFLENARGELSNAPFYPLAAARFELAYARLQIPEIAFEAAQAYREAFETTRPKATVPERRAAYRARAIALYKVYLARRPDGDDRGEATAKLRHLEDVSAPSTSMFVIAEPAVDPVLDRALDWPRGTPCLRARGVRDDLLECAFAEQRAHGLTAEQFEVTAKMVQTDCPRFEAILVKKRRELGCE